MCRNAINYDITKTPRNSLTKCTRTIQTKPGEDDGMTVQKENLSSNDKCQ